MPFSEVNIRYYQPEKSDIDPGKLNIEYSILQDY